MSDIFGIHGHVIAATGATGALVGAAARHLIEQGATVVYLSRSQEKADKAAAEAKGGKGDAFGMACDVTDRADMERVRDEILKRCGRIDGLINGAGGNMPGATIPPEKRIFDLDLKDCDMALHVNLNGTLTPTLVIGETMAEAGKGSIVNFSSMAAQRALTRVLGYSNAKAAVDSLTRWMAVEMARRHGDGIRVNAVAPGFFIGDQNRALLLKDDGEPTERGGQVIGQTPMGRFGNAPEICGAIHYLLSPASSFVTGTILAVDGGFSAFSGV